MEKSFQLPGYRIFEYQLVLNPPVELRKKIIEVKQHFFDTYQADTALYSKPYLLLSSFTQYEMVEERLRHRLHAIAMARRTFKVELKDFGAFPAHTIYIRLGSKNEVRGLVRQLKSEARPLMGVSGHKPYFNDDPHLTIARKLLPWQYEKAWQEYSHRSFTGRFIADGMLLLKRAPGEARYQVVQHFNFENLLVENSQGSLFP